MVTVDIERQSTGERVTITRDVLHQATELLRGGVKVPGEDDFEANASDWLAAPELEKLAGELVGRYDELAACEAATIRYAWKREGGPDGEAGKCKKLGKEARFIAGGVDFFVWLAADKCAALSGRQIEALLYHELCHVGQDEKERPTIVKHDTELFRSELRRYGAWTVDLQETARTFEQLGLPL